MICKWKWVRDSLGCLAKIVPILVTLASLLTAAIPNPSPETTTFLLTLHKVLDVLALNIGNNNLNF